MANRQLFVNNLKLRLANGVSETDTIFNLEDATQIPALADNDFVLLTFYALEGTEEVNHEIVKATAVNGNSITVERGHDNTAARSWGLGTNGELRNNAATMSRMRDKTETAQNAATAAQNAAGAALKPSDLLAANGAEKVSYADPVLGTITVKAKFDDVNTRLAAAGGAVPIATTTTAGIVKASPQFQIDAGGVPTIKIANATDAVPGLVRIGTGFNYDPVTATLNNPATSGTGTTADATTTSKGIVQIGAGLVVNNGLLTNPTVLATRLIAGAMRPGPNLNYDPATGIADVTFPAPPAPPPDASKTVKGIMQVGGGLVVGNGVVSVANPLATDTIPGVIRIGTGFNYDLATGTLNAVPPPSYTPPPLGSKTVAGLLQVGDGLVVNGGVVALAPSGAVPVATRTTAGIVVVGNNLTVDSNGRLDAAGGQGNVTYTTIITGDGIYDGGAHQRKEITQPAGRVLSVHDEGVFYVINMADYFDPRSGSVDISAKNNDIMNFGSDLAQNMANTSFHGLHPASYVRLFYPRGMYRIAAEQQIIPSNLDIDCHGIFKRAGSGEMADKYLPMFVCSSMGHMTRNNLQGHETGRATGGSMFAGHKLFVSSEMKLEAGGGGYAVGNEFNLPKRTSSLLAARIRVTGVGTNGTITTFSVVTHGAYDCHRRQIGILGDPNKTGSAQAKFSVVSYENPYKNGHYDAGSYRIFGQMLIDHLQAREGGLVYGPDSVKGYNTAIHIMGLNCEINQMFAHMTRQGFFFTEGSDARINNLNTVLCGTAWRTVGYGALTIANFAYDTSYVEALKTSGSQGIVQMGRFFWENNAGDKQDLRDDGIYAHQSGAAINVSGGGRLNQLASGHSWKVNATNAGGSRSNNNAGYFKWAQFWQPVMVVDGVIGCNYDIACVNGEYGGRMEPSSKPVNALYSFGNSMTTYEAQTWFDPATNSLVKTDTAPTGGTLVRNRVQVERKLSMANTFAGEISNLPNNNSPVYLGDAGGATLRIVDGDLGGTCGRNDIYEGLTVTGVPGSSFGAGKAGMGTLARRQTAGAVQLYMNIGSKTTPSWKLIAS